MSINLAIKSVIDDWVRGAGLLFSFELRCPYPISPTQLGPNSGQNFTNFIIEVTGFFEDEEHTQPIKLHYERVISIDNYNHSQQYINDFRRDLKLLTEAAHESFFQDFIGKPSARLHFRPASHEIIPYEYTYRRSNL